MVHSDGFEITSLSYTTFQIITEVDPDQVHRLPGGRRRSDWYGGSVLAVRWAHHGRFLASGSDDTVIVIWGIDP